MKLTPEPEKGESIYFVSERACQQAKQFNQNVQFDFNGINMDVSRFSFCDDIAYIYSLKSEIRRADKQNNFKY